MSNEYDFTKDDQTALTWESADESSINSELQALSSRFTNLIQLLETMVYKNDYDNTDNAFSWIWMNDLSVQGYVPSFYENNKNALNPYSGGSLPSWYHSSTPETQKSFNTAIRYFADFGLLANHFKKMRQAMMLFPLKTAFRFQRITLNFDEAGYGEELYHTINKDMEEVSRIINQSWDVMERNASASARYYNEQGGRVSRSEMIQGYRKARIRDYEMEYDISPIRKSFDMRSDGTFSVKPAMMAKAVILDKYTLQISVLENIEDAMKDMQKSCIEINSGIQADYDKFRTPQCRQLADALTKMIRALNEFAETSLHVYTCYKNRDTDQPYIFERPLPALSTMKPRYGFEPLNADPWHDGTQFEALYKRAAKALSAHCREFVYDHGHPELK